MNSQEKAQKVLEIEQQKSLIIEQSRLDGGPFSWDMLVVWATGYAAALKDNSVNAILHKNGIDLPLR